MKRRKAKFFIDRHIKEGKWKVYFAPPISPYQFNISERLLRLYETAIPFIMDAMQAIAANVETMVAESPLSLVEHDNDGDNCLMGQLEFLMNVPVKCAQIVIFYKGQWWIDAEEFFPF